MAVRVGAIDIVESHRVLSDDLQRRFSRLEDFRVDRIAQSGYKSIDSRLYLFHNEFLGGSRRVRKNIDLVSALAQKLDSLADVTGGKHAKFLVHGLERFSQEILQQRFWAAITSRAIGYHTRNQARIWIGRAVSFDFASGESFCLEPPVKLVDPVIAGSALHSHPEAVFSGGIDVCLWFITRGDQNSIEPGDRFEHEFIVLRPGHENRGQIRRDCRHHPEGAAIDRSGEGWTHSRILLEQYATGHHRPGGESHESDSVRGNAPFHRVLSRDSHRLNAIGDAVFASFVEIQIGRDSISFLFLETVFQHEGRYASIDEPLRDFVGFKIDGKRDAGASGRDDDAGSRSFVFWWQEGRQGWCDYVRNDFADWSVAGGSLRLGPLLRTGGHAGPEIDRLGV